MSLSVITVWVICALPATVYPASKAKPDLPMGEEKDPHAAAPAQHGEEKNPHATAPAQHGEEKNPHATAPAQHGEEKDPHATAPAQHGEETSPPAAAHGTDHAKGHSEDHDVSGGSTEEKHSGKLLEGKVDPALPSQGKGFIWFAVVFVVLAVSIFIFT